MKTTLALGTFDGVHLGHKEVLSRAVKSGGKTVCVAFRKPPKSFYSETGVILTDENRKTLLIKEQGVDEVYYIDYENIKDCSAEDFFDFIVKEFAPTSIFCGFNYTFGKGALGDAEMLGKLCKEKGILLNVCEGVQSDGDIVSSTRIRLLLKNGEIKKANLLLSNDFSFESEIIHGDARGRTIGFPTINQCYPKEMAACKNGVYRTKVIVDGKEYNGMSNIGVRPTYKTENIMSETFLFDFSGNIYGKTARIILKEFIREEKKFSTLGELKNAIDKDKQYIQSVIDKNV